MCMTGLIIASLLVSRAAGPPSTAPRKAGAARLLSQLVVLNDKAHRHHYHLIDRWTGRMLLINGDGTSALFEQAIQRLGYRLMAY
jgi:hypothetical protein